MALAAGFTPGLRRRTLLFAALFATSLVTAAVFANLISYRRGQRYDLTRSGRFTLQQRTLQTLAGLPRTVTVTTLFMPQTKRRRGEGELVSQVAGRVHETLRLFARHTRRLEIVTLDPIRDRARVQALVARFRGKDLEDTLILEAGENRVFVKGWELARLDLRRMRVVRWQAEETLVSALLRVTEQRPRLVLVLPGQHRLDGGLSVFAAMLEPENVRLRAFALDRPVPAECDLLLLPGPREDLTTSQARSLQRYLDDGGRLLAVIPPSRQRLPNLETVLAAYGARPLDHLVMRERQLGFATTELSPEHPVTAPIRDLPVYLSYARSFEPVPATRPGAAYHPLLAGARDKQLWEDVQLLPGRPQTPRSRPPYHLAAAVGWPAPPRDGAPQLGRMVLVGSDSLLEDQLLDRRGLGNHTLAHNIVQWLLDRENRILAGATGGQPSGEVFLEERRALALGFSLVAFAPLTAFFIGILVWLFRKD